MPQNLFIVDPLVLTPNEHVARTIFKGKLDTYVKRKAYLNQNI
jgi:hypothetical protein